MVLSQVGRQPTRQAPGQLKTWSHTQDCHQPTQRERERETDRQTDRDREREAGRQKKKKKETSEL
jgi:hypothetical protein